MYQRWKFLICIAAENVSMKTRKLAFARLQRRGDVSLYVDNFLS
jgi:hypothetical protein